MVLIAVIICPYEMPADDASERLKSYNQELIRLGSEDKKLQKEKSLLEKTLITNKNKERVYANKIIIVKKQINITEKKIKLLENEISATERDIEITQGEIDKATGELWARKNRMRDRLRGIYKNGKTDFLEAFFTPFNYGYMEKKFRFLKLVGVLDAKMIRDVEYQKKVVEEKKKELESEKARLQKLKTRRLSEHNTSNRQKKELESLLKRTKHTIEESEVKIDEIKKRMTVLDAKIKELTDKIYKLKTPTPGDGLSTGLPWPVDGVVLHPFGKYFDKEYNVWRHNKGIDIKSRKGAKVVSVQKGTVRFADFLPGYGQLILIDHGKTYYSVYGGLDEISVKVNQTVSQEQKIGVLGEMDADIGAVMHFEIRVGDVPQDPMRYLEKK